MDNYHPDRAHRRDSPELRVGRQRVSGTDHECCPHVSRPSLPSPFQMVLRSTAFALERPVDPNRGIVGSLTYSFRWPAVGGRGAVVEKEANLFVSRDVGGV